MCWFVEQPTKQLRRHGAGKRQAHGQLRETKLLNADLGGTILSKGSRLPRGSGQAQDCSSDEKPLWERLSHLPAPLPVAGGRVLPSAPARN